VQVRVHFGSIADPAPLMRGQNGNVTKRGRASPVA